MPRQAWVCDHCREPFPTKAVAEWHEQQGCLESIAARIRADRAAIGRRLKRLFDLERIRELENLLDDRESAKLRQELEGLRGRLSREGTR